MYSIMKTGAKVEIKPFAKGTENYVASTFWMEHGTIWSYNSCMGAFPRPEMTEESFTEHLTNMVNEGFQIVIKQPA